MKALLLVGVLLSVGTLTFAEPAGKVVEKAQTTCPIMGEGVSKKIFVDYQGQRIYFCCKGCPAAFNKDPEKYLKKFKEDGVTLEKVPVKEAGKQ